MKIYISGPITGIEKFNVDAFESAENQVAAMGHTPVNPQKILGKDQCSEWLDHMRQDIKSLMDCDGIVMLPNWIGSHGAKIEYHLSMALGIKIYSTIKDLEDETDKCDGEC